MIHVIYALAFVWMFSISGFGGWWIGTRFEGWWSIFPAFGWGWFVGWFFARVIFPIIATIEEEDEKDYSRHDDIP